MEIVQNILNIIKKNKMTDQQLCKLLNTNSNKIYDWKKGKSKPSAIDVLTIADYLGCSTDYLLGRESTQENSNPHIQELINVASNLSDENLQKTIEYMELLKLKQN